MWRLPAAFVALALAVICLPAESQRLDRGPSETIYEGGNVPEGVPDPERGGLIALRGRGCGKPDAECSACFLCHGREGSGSSTAPFPRLTGQSYLYLYTALQDFALGVRKNPVMSPIASSLSREAMRDVSAFYALADPDQEFEAWKAEALSDPEYHALARGAMLANFGDMTKGIQACVNCHGPNGIGLPPVYPYLAGQYRNYLVDRLHAFRNAEQVDSPLGIMHDIATRMSDEDIEQVATYFAAVRPVKHPRQGLVPGLDVPDPDVGMPAEVKR